MDLFSSAGIALADPAPAEIAPPWSRCPVPGCGRRLTWSAFQVHAAGGVRMPGEEFTYADCRCGMTYRRKRPRDEG